MRTGDLDPRSQCEDPAKELTADCRGDRNGNMVIIDRGDGNLFAKTVDEDANQIIFKFNGDIFHIPIIHSKMILRVLRHIDAAIGISAQPAGPQDADIPHLVHAVVLEFFIKGIITEKIIVFVVPYQTPRAHGVGRAIPAFFQFLVDVPFTVMELDLVIFIDGLENRINGQVSSFVARLDAAENVNLTLQFLPFIVADELFELADKSIRFVLVDEFGCLHGIDEELDFR